jgi:hypothetical protein
MKSKRTLENFGTSDKTFRISYTVSCQRMCLLVVQARTVQLRKLIPGGWGPESSIFWRQLTKKPSLPRGSVLATYVC